MQNKPQKTPNKTKNPKPPPSPPKKKVIHIVLLAGNLFLQYFFDLSQCYLSESEIWFCIWHNNNTFFKKALYFNFFKHLDDISCTTIFQRETFSDNVFSCERQCYIVLLIFWYFFFFNTVKLHPKSTSTRSPWWRSASQHQEILELIKWILMWRRIKILKVSICSTNIFQCLTVFCFVFIFH